MFGLLVLIPVLESKGMRTIKEDRQWFGGPGGRLHLKGSNNNKAYRMGPQY